MLERNNVYNFSTVNDAILNQNFKAVKVTGVVDFKIASSHMNVASRHAALKPYINDTEEQIEDLRTMNYYVIEFPNGLVTVLAEAWIVKESIELVSEHKVDLTFTFANKSEEQELLHLLRVHGYRFKVTS